MTKDNQDQFLIVRISSRTKEFLQKLAAAQDISLSKWVRTYLIEDYILNGYRRESDRQAKKESNG